MYFDAYFLSKQDTILSFLKKFEIFLFIDLIKEFFQQNIESRDYWKTIFATLHRKLKWLIVSNMKLKNILNFFQNRMKKIFESHFWKFVLMYINNIIIYSVNFDQHLFHFDEILYLLKRSEMILALKKCHFEYPNIKALNHHVFRLKLNIFEKKRKS